MRLLNGLAFVTGGSRGAAALAQPCEHDRASRRAGKADLSRPMLLAPRTDS
jgi:hypothetical protein